MCLWANEDDWLDFQRNHPDPNEEITVYKAVVRTPKGELSSPWYDYPWNPGMNLPVGELDVRTNWDDRQIYHGGCFHAVLDEDALDLEQAAEAGGVEESDAVPLALRVHVGDVLAVGTWGDRPGLRGHLVFSKALVTEEAFARALEFSGHDEDDEDDEC